MIRTIGIVSGKGGVGKTVTTINLAAAMMEFKSSVIAVDADIKMSGLGLHLGMCYFPVTLNDVLKDTVNVFNALYIHSSGLRIIPASLAVDPVDTSKLGTVLLNPYFENTTVLVDSPPGLGNDAIQVLKACKENIIVTLPEIPAVADTIRVIDVIRELGAIPLGIIVNRYKTGDPNQLSIKEIETACELPIIGTIPEDKNIRKSIYKKTPAVFLNPYSSSSIAFKKIAARILGLDYKPPRYTFFKKLFWRSKG
jgi:cell division ATPase MinD